MIFFHVFFYVTASLMPVPINVLTVCAGDTYTDTYSYKFTAVRGERFD
jgi:hypothetical protein